MVRMKFQEQIAIGIIVIAVLVNLDLVENEDRTTLVVPKNLIKVASISAQHEPPYNFSTTIQRSISNSINIVATTSSTTTTLPPFTPSQP